MILANKVLSPQYLAWLLPFAALLPGPQALLLVAASVLTTIEYPILFDALRAIDPFPVLVVNVRNAMLLVLFVWILVDSSSAQSAAMLEKPPTSPAATPNTSTATATLRRHEKITETRIVANATLTTFAKVSPGRPVSWASKTTNGFASAAKPVARHQGQERRVVEYVCEREDDESECGHSHDPVSRATGSGSPLLRATIGDRKSVAHLKLPALPMSVDGQ